MGIVVKQSLWVAGGGGGGDGWVGGMAGGVSSREMYGEYDWESYESTKSVESMKSGVVWCGICRLGYIEGYGMLNERVCYVDK